MKPKKTSSAKPLPSAISQPLWQSSPMDWQPIDRFILLASLVLLAPGCFAISLIWASLVSPEYFNTSILYGLLGLYAIHILVLAGFIGAALKRRKTHPDWPLFENIIIGGYILTVMASGYATGAHFAEGLLLLFLGVNITSALANIDKIRFSYWFVVPAMLVMGWMDFSSQFTFAPLMELPLTDADGKPIMAWMIGRAIIAGILSILIYVCILAVRRWVQREDLYREMSTIDGLTRLSNRSSFIQRGHEELARAKRQTPPPPGSLACIMLDLDHFKFINDTWGHHAGDAVLVTASRIMMENARQYDEVGRYGGEEFAVLLPGVTLDTAAAIAERLRQKISEAAVNIDGHTISVTASLGVACYPAPDINDLNDLLKAADAALYQAKTGGRNRVKLALHTLTTE